MRKVKYTDLGIAPYQKIWEMQEQMMSELIADKKVLASAGSKESGNIPHHLLFVEHPPVFTLGKSGDTNNLLLNNSELAEKGASFYKTDRGGDITYHGPGQLVGYPILDLEDLGIGLRQYIYMLEEVVICSLGFFGLHGSRDPLATGVWMDVGLPQARKICAIGVRSSRFVTMHGFALNVNTDLTYFRYINPCGIVDKGVTSMRKECQGGISMEEVKSIVLSNFIKIFSIQLVS